MIRGTLPWSQCADMLMNPRHSELARYPMKLFPPQNEPVLYEEGFGDTDLLGRRASGLQLSELLERVDDPVVIAVDGAWGSGKSHFLKRWVGAHVKENGGTATTVYFDAFTNDYLDEPLIGLTGAIGDRLRSPKDHSKWQKAKTMAFRLARPATRVGAAMLTSGITEVTGPVLDAAIASTNKELEKAAEAFWNREDGRKAAMKQFRETLSQLTSSSEAGGAEGKPLIVVIDELDRCRPDYALSVLEVVKHFFAVPRVHFILGVNLGALAHIVQARYGAGVNAEDYLKRFISLSMQLPEFVPGHQSTRSQVKYFETAATAMGIEPNLVSVAKKHLELAAAPASISLRDVEKLLSRLVLLPKRKEFSGYLWGWQELIVSLVLLQVMRPDLFRSAFTGRLSLASIDVFYGILPEMVSTEARDTDGYNHHAYVAHGLWASVLGGGKDNAGGQDEFAAAFDTFGRRSTKNVLLNLQRDFFSTFEFLEQ